MSNYVRNFGLLYVSRSWKSRSQNASAAAFKVPPRGRQRPPRWPSAAELST